MKRIILLSFTLIALIGSLTGNGLSQKPACGEKDYDCQIKDFQAKIKADPRNIELYYELGLAYEYKEDYAQAVVMFDKYLAGGVTDPQYLADAYVERGYSYGKLGKPDRAVSDYTQAIKYVATNPQYYSDRGDAYSDLKNYDSAIADYTKAITMDPESAVSYEGRGYVYMEKTEYPQAIADFTKAIELNPETPEAFYNRGTSYYRLRQYAKAIPDLTRYIELNQSTPQYLADGYINRGLAQLYSGFPSKAVADFTKAIELAPNEKEAYIGRALAYRQLRKNALADADDKKAASLPDDK